MLQRPVLGLRYNLLFKIEENTTNQTCFFCIFPGDRIQDVFAFVCDGSTCILCGQFVEVGLGQWGSVQCDNGAGVEGDSVAIGAADNFLQIAEIQLQGTSNL